MDPQQVNIPVPRLAGPTTQPIIYQNFYHGTPLHTAIFCGLIAPALCLFLLAFPQPSDPKIFTSGWYVEVIFLGGIGLVSLIICRRTIRQKIISTPAGLEIHRKFSTKTIPWADIAALDWKQSYTIGKKPFAKTKNGKKYWLYAGFYTSKVGYNPYYALSPADPKNSAIMAQLNSHVSRLSLPTTTSAPQTIGDLLASHPEADAGEVLEEAIRNNRQ